MQIQPDSNSFRYERRNGSSALWSSGLPGWFDISLDLQRYSVSSQQHIWCELRQRPANELAFLSPCFGSGTHTNTHQTSIYVNKSPGYVLCHPCCTQDYGTLMCWARNLVGEQSQPCVFQVVEASVPNSLTDCTATNITWESVHVACRPGYDGGVPQHFRIQVVMENSPSIVTNRSAHLPSFPIHNLEANSNYIITIWAENIKGRSDAQVIPVTTLHATGPTRMKSSDGKPWH